MLNIDKLKYTFKKPLLDLFKGLKAIQVNPINEYWIKNNKVIVDYNNYLYININAPYIDIITKCYLRELIKRIVKLDYVTFSSFDVIGDLKKYKTTPDSILYTIQKKLGV
jgi:hypothetical protein